MFLPEQLINTPNCYASFEIDPEHISSEKSVDVSVED